MKFSSSGESSFLKLSSFFLSFFSDDDDGKFKLRLLFNFLMRERKGERRREKRLFKIHFDLLALFLFSLSGRRRKRGSNRRRRDVVFALKEEKKKEKRKKSKARIRMKR